MYLVQRQVDGKLTPFGEWEEPNTDLASTCDIASCAMRGDAWDGPIMSCYCQDTAGDWDLTEVNLSKLVPHLSLLTSSPLAHTDNLNR